MNAIQNQFKNLETRLADRAALLREEMKREREALEQRAGNQLTDASGDNGDEAVALMTVDINAYRIERQLKEIAAIEAACTRMENGSYGICTHCGIDIDYKRLIANPAAHRCIDCQRNYERTYAAL
jgi:RNA polymerase-binding protein DksA